LATEWATSQSVTVTIPSADSDDTFNDALDALAAKVREYARPTIGGLNDNRRIAAVAVDLVKALRDTRAQAMQDGRNRGYTYRSSSTLISIDRVLLGVIGNYIDQIEAEWA
jgi:hypothetical protein